MKKSILIIVAALVCVSAYALLYNTEEASAEGTVSDESGSCGENATYVFNSATGTLTISGTGTMTDYTDTNAPWYDYRSQIKTVMIGDSITSVGVNAFKDCSELTSVTIGKFIVSIGEFAFANCTHLDTVLIGWVNLNPSVSSDAFSNAGVEGKGISVIFGDSVKRIPGNLFKVSHASNAPKVTALTIGSSVTTIGTGAFNDCIYLEKVNFNAVSCGDANLDNALFTNAGTAGNGISVVFGDTVTKVPKDLFSVSDSSDAPKVTSVTIGKNVTSLGMRAFYNCVYLETLNFDAVSCSTVSLISSLFTNAGTAGNGISVVFGDSVQKIPAGILRGDLTDAPKVTSVTIGKNVTSIGASAFYNLTYLTEINYNATACEDATGTSALFSNAGTAGNGISVVFGDSVTKIPAYLFHISDASNAPKIISVAIGQNVTSIGASAFYNLTHLTEINFNAAACADGLETSDFFFKAGTAGNGISVVFGDSVTKIPANLFSVMNTVNAPKIISVVLGQNVISIGDNAFFYCSGITSLTIPDSVTSLGKYAFYMCSGITSLTIGKNVTSMGQYAFCYLTNLTEINFNATACGDMSSGLNLFTDGGINGNGISVVFGDSVTKIPAYLFQVSGTSNPPKITSLTIGEKVTSIGSNAFYECSSITSLTIPDSVTTIESYAFYECSGITSLTIGKNVTSIKSYAFCYLTNLTGISYNATACGDATGTSALFSNAGTAGNGISVVFGDSVTKIPAYLFHVSDASNAPKITSLTIGENVVDIGIHAFENNTYLSKIDFNATSHNAITQKPDIFFNAGTAGNGIFVVFGDSVTKIPSSLFQVSDNSKAPKITSVTIGKNVTSIGPDLATL